jgi:hypothetical protein
MLKSGFGSVSAGRKKRNRSADGLWTGQENSFLFFFGGKGMEKME